MQWEDGTCEIHGDRLIVECQMCGREFCGLCASNRRVCPDCAEEDWDHDEDYELEEDADDEEEEDGLSLGDDDGIDTTSRT